MPMIYRDATGVNTLRVTVPTAPAVILLPSNPKRKSFLISPVAAGTSGALSISPRADVAAGAGSINYLTGATYPTLIDDTMVGDQIGIEWYITSANGGEVVEVTEFIYVDC